MFLKIISSHTHAFCSSISMLWVVPIFFFQKLCFSSNFVSLCPCRSIHSIFRTIEIFFKIVLLKSLSVSIDKSYFSIDRNSWIKFFKKLRLDCFKLTFSNFPLSLSLSPTWQGSTEDFLSFSAKLFARFFSPKAGKTFIPFLLHLFSCFHA